jgi:SSS family solute:Na+ symporter
MELEVTSAYEILEKQLGVSIRVLGSLLFLSLRFLWMASIVYWTTMIVLIPAAGIDERHASKFAILLGVITVIYTSMGGLRAVVVTDVIQTSILFSGAVVSLVLITCSLGGVGAWLPTKWEHHWTAPRIWFDFDPNTRSTLANAMLSTFSWYVCTAGADQMAVQRYLATRDVQAARRSLAISLSTDFIVVMFLGLIGLALLAFFSAHPEQLVDQQTVYANADKLFPRFVVVGLPVGMSGLVIAGLLAAAMSSLSSGVNSSAAVITEDLIRRGRPHGDDEFKHIRQVRWTSVAVGIVVVLLSSLIGSVQGNMLEVIYKVANLFTAPLFYLVFMAMFVPWSNAAGTWVGSAAGIATAILIAFGKDIFGTPGISFLWIMPGSFCVSLLTGMLASLLFGGRPSGSMGKKI